MRLFALANSRQADTWLCGEEVDSSRAIAVLFDETAVILCTWSRVDCSPAVLTVIAETVDIATEVGGIASSTVHAMTLITHLVIKNIRLHLDLCVCRDNCLTEYVNVQVCEGG